MSVSLLIFTFVNVWWLSLFVVLPFGIKREESPEVGHSTGAPKNPQLKQKAIATSVLAAAITAGIYFYVSDANAAPYVAGEDKCATVDATAQEDVEYKPATGEESPDYSRIPPGTQPQTNMPYPPVNTDKVEMDLDIPVSNYTTNNPDLSETHIGVGKIVVENDKASLNGVPLGGAGGGSVMDCAK